MKKFSELISSGDTVVEIGGHIGFISQYFSQLVGEEGKVIVFEPGSNNLQYIKKNILGKDNIYLEQMAISDRSGTAFFMKTILLAKIIASWPIIKMQISFQKLITRN